MSVDLSSDLDVAQALYKVLEDIEEKLQEIQATLGASSAGDASEKLTELNVNSYLLYTTMRRLISSLQRLGLGTEWNGMLTKMMQLVQMAHTLQIALTAFEAGTPLGWVLLAISAFSLGTQALSAVTPNQAPIGDITASMRT